MAEDGGRGERRKSGKGWAKEERENRYEYIFTATAIRNKGVSVLSNDKEIDITKLRKLPQQTKKWNV